MTNQRILFVGLDAGDADLIDRWCHEGWLPNISRMRSEGTSFRMRTTAEIFHVSAWSSIFTGTPPDQHGLYHAYVTVPGHQGLLRPRPDRSPVPFVWKLLSDRGKRSVIVDAFLTCPLRDFNGIQIVDWGSWSWFSDPTILPSSAARQIKRKFGAYPSDDHSKVGITPVTDVGRFRQRLLDAVARKRELVRWLIESQDWDFFLVVFAECHPAGHYFWYLHDPSYITHPAGGAGALGHALRDIYVALDAAVGELLRTIGTDTEMWLVSGDGMGPNYSGSHLLPRMLSRMGALDAQNSATADQPAGAQPRGGRDLLHTIRGLVPQTLRIAISQAFLSRQTQDQLAMRWKIAGISWPTTRAYVIENANEGYIRINLKGREPMGTVAPGPEYEALCADLCHAANTMVHPGSGMHCASAVYKTDDICSGPLRSHLPDVVIVWNPEARVTTEVLTEKYGLVRAPEPSCGTAPFYSGNHRANAFLVATGPDVPKGLTLDQKDVLDLAPTILHRFGIEPPDHMSGRILPALRGRSV
jgi:predicted AlkP superfamily phosphohydrolase/phosphomutase